MQKNNSFSIAILLIITLLPFNCVLSQAVPSSQISDSPMTIIGFNHIGISVKNLEAILPFYLQATGLEVVKREKISHSKNADLLFGVKGIAYETVTLKAPNMLLELTEFSNQQSSKIRKMPPQGPGMTHTCYQSPAWDSGYDKFLQAEADLLSRGDKPVDLGGYGVTYAYVYDPEGNMIEVEQLDQAVLNRNGVDSLWLQSNPMWMTQVALISPNLDKLTNFYQEILGIPPYRKGEYGYENSRRFDDVVDMDDFVFKAAWFRMDRGSKMLELMQYVHPVPTPTTTQIKSPTDLGYSFSIEVEDIQTEYNRLKKLGVQFLSEPLILGEFWMVFANDVDGNVFSLRQATNPASVYAIKNVVGNTTISDQKEAIKSRLIDMWDAIEKGDIERYATYIHPDFTQFGETDPVLKIGKDTEVSGVKEWVKNSTAIQTKMDDPKITINGNVAWITYYWSDNGSTNGKSFASRGKSTRIFVKEDGNWLCIHGHYTLLSNEKE